MQEGRLEKLKTQKYRDAMTGMALLAYLGHCELQDSPTFGPTVQKGINFLTSTPPDKQIGAGNYDPTPTQYAHMLSAKRIP